ncbi:MAG TPA: heavy-metal-associated domain-containing protein [Firmicutes bacterium]|nr:heavy-metal-associated domain-containing protein [Bacillota bacterium]
MAKKTYQLKTLACPTCAAKIESVLKKTAGVQEVEVLYNSSRVRAEFDESVVTSEELKGKIEGLGYQVLSEK